ncbi:zeatin O-glucosyltransferase-like [Silene latifolia]|uniref:zeatin O-glucosyltransferase-like n=1 Tax=Silene latifolia TaxID=37657 RepID=UPI003D788047
MENSNIKNGVKHQTIAFLAVPFLPQGHLTAILNFTYLLTNYGFPVHVAAPGQHNRQAKLRLQVSDPNDFCGKIQFHDLQLPNFSSPPPNPNHDPSVQFPDHLQPLFDIIPKLRQPVFELVAELAQKYTKLIIIHDYFMAFVVQDAKTIPNVELYNFIAPSAFTTFFHYWETMPGNNPLVLGSQVIDPSIVPTNDGCFTPEFVEFLAKQEKLLGSESGFLINTSRVIEGTYVDLLESLSVKTYAVGPFHPIPEPEKDQLPNKERNICLQWLDKQKTESSVILVAFGSATTLHEKQIEELAIGLERSGQKFIWALRSADKGNEETEGGVTNLSALLPEGYEEMIKDKGIVVREWVPQLEILAHPSIGGFLSHCGWLSCLESMSMGVPIATWPIHSDHPKNATFVTEVLKIGVVVRDWAKRSEIVKSITIENAIRKLMDSEEGLEIRKNVQRVCVDVRRAMAEGGASRLEMDSFVARVTK